MLRQRQGQSFLEFSLVITTVVVIIFAMQPMIKRSTQAMIKLMADQIGNQEAADQIAFEDAESRAEAALDGGGFLDRSFISTRAETEKTRKEFFGVTTYEYDDRVVTTSNALIDLGISRQGPR